MKTLLLHVFSSLILLLSSSNANNINAGGQEGLVRVMSVQTAGRRSFNLGAAFKFDRDQYFVAGPNGSAQVLDSINGTYLPIGTTYLYSGLLYFNYGVTSFWDVSTNLPIYHDESGWGYDQSGLGNLDIATKLVYPVDQSTSIINQAYYLKLTLPTGSKFGAIFPRHAYYIRDAENGLNSISFSDYVVIPMMAWSIFFDRINEEVPLALHINLGGAGHSTTAFLAAIGLEYKPHDVMTLFFEISTESKISRWAAYYDTYTLNDDILRFTPGVKINHRGILDATLAFDFGFSDKNKRAEWYENGFRYATSGSPVFGLQASLVWKGSFMKTAPETDTPRRAVKNKTPSSKPTGDTAPPSTVKSISASGAIDDCPEEAEDMDGYQDDDGCPDIDNDMDGILDVNDNCPDVPEDRDGFESLDGCPDYDNDEDGIPDSTDNCPDIKGSPENNGCAKTAKKAKPNLMLEGVEFKVGGAVLTDPSFKVLDDLVTTLKERREVQIEIQGHTDSKGNEDKNKKLSQDRADAIRRYLISKGIDPGRLTAVGYGEHLPIADNKSEEGRKKNRRIELKRLD